MSPAPSLPWSPLVGAALAIVLSLLTWWALLRIPDPEPEPGAPVVHYRGLVTRPAVLLTTALSMALGTVAVGRLGNDGWPLVVWGSAALVLIWVDLRSTYLPSRLQWPITALTALVVLGSALDTGHGDAPVRAGLCALAGAGLFWIFWRFGPGLGFGDVRLALCLGLVTGQRSWQWWWAALLAGTVIGAVWGLVVQRWPRLRPDPSSQGFPYGPALWLGVWVALPLT